MHFSQKKFHKMVVGREDAAEHEENTAEEDNAVENAEPDIKNAEQDVNEECGQGDYLQCRKCRHKPNQ